MDVDCGHGTRGFESMMDLVDVSIPKRAMQDPMNAIKRSFEDQHDAKKADGFSSKYPLVGLLQSRPGRIQEIP
jgi:hypothetical protein